MRLRKTETRLKNEYKGREKFFFHLSLQRFVFEYVEVYLRKNFFFIYWWELYVISSAWIREKKKKKIEEEKSEWWVNNKLLNTFSSTEEITSHRHSSIQDLIDTIQHDRNKETLVEQLSLLFEDTYLFRFIDRSISSSSSCYSSDADDDDDVFLKPK